MFALRSLKNPLTSELYEWSAWDLFDFVQVRYFRTVEAAFAAVEAEVEEENTRNNDPQGERLRLLDADENNGTTTWVFGVEGGEPFAELACHVHEDKSDFWWYSCGPVVVEE